MKYLIVSIIVLMNLSCDKENPISSNREDNGVVLNIPLSGSLQNPGFSPDDKNIIFTRFVNGYNMEPAEIYKYNIESEELTKLVSDGSGNVNLPGSSWNNGKIVFSSSREPHDEIYLIEENGSNGEELKITNRPNDVAYEPTMSPDGEWVVFESHRLDKEDDGVITKYKIGGGSTYVQLSSAVDDCRQPNWSPSNNRILYQRNIDNKWSIWVMDIDGSDKFKVTKDIGNCTDASFTKDGEYIIYSSDFESNIANINKISIDGDHTEKLTQYNGYDGAPSISNDGSKLIFESTEGYPDDSKGTKLIILEL